MTVYRLGRYVYVMELMTTGQIADKYPVSVRTLHRMVRAGELPVAQRLPGAPGIQLFDPLVVAAVFAQRGRDRRHETVDTAR